jgi:hypothetical protein
VDAERVWPHTYLILPWKQNFFSSESLLVAAAPQTGSDLTSSQSSGLYASSIITIIGTLRNKCDGAMT